MQVCGQWIGSRRNAACVGIAPDHPAATGFDPQPHYSTIDHHYYGMARAVGAGGHGSLVAQARNKLNPHRTCANIGQRRVACPTFYVSPDP